MSPEEFFETYPNYIANLREKRSAAATSMYESLTPREQSLVRDAAVMGFVQGSRITIEERGKFPADSEIIEEVLLACQWMSDLYPTIGGLDA